MADKPKVKSFQLTGAGNVSPQTLASGLFGLISIGLLWFYFLGGLEWWTGKKVDDIYIQTAEKLESEYRLMGSESSEIDKCVKAGTVAAAWLQAEDRQQYQSWKQVEKRHCEASGVTQ